MEALSTMQRQKAARQSPRFGTGWVTRTAAITLGLATCGVTSRAKAQDAAPTTTLTGKLQSMAARAGTIFCGQVVSIEQRHGYVEITFRVDQAVAHAPESTFVLREWSGLWPLGLYRFVVGQRVMLFANPASAGGYSSPVDGAEGVVPLVVQGADAPALLDVRRLAASVLRTPKTPLPTEADGAVQLPDVLALLASGTAGRQGEDPVRHPLPVRQPRRENPPLRMQPVGVLPRPGGVEGRPIALPVRGEGAVYDAR